MMRFYKRLSLRLFGRIADVFLPSFAPLKPYIAGAGMNIFLKTWVCLSFLTSFLVYILSLIFVILIGLFMAFDFAAFLYYSIFIPVMLASFSLLFFYAYPVQRAKSARGSIERNLPFALAHMSAVASSGIPPEFIFEPLMGFKEYGEISRQAGLVVRNIKNLGMSSVNAIKSVAARTPSPEFRQVLAGMQSVIEKGGDLASYLNEMAERSLFDYRIKRENYLKTLSTYADVYTALLVTAPLMMLVVLGIMSTIGGDILGFTAGDLTSFIVFVLVPVLNILFIVFLHLTSPEA